MNYNELFSQIKIKKSFLCVGLDTDIQKIPKFLHEDGNEIFTFNREIIDATQEYAVAYKHNRSPRVAGLRLRRGPTSRSAGSDARGLFSRKALYPRTSESRSC